MKKSALLLLLAGCLFMQSCATVFGGRVTDCQRTRPQRNEPRRQIRAVALIADILCSPIICLPVDFITCAIYKPCDTYRGTMHHYDAPVSHQQ